MGGWRKDLGYALRSLARSPGFTVVTLFTLALGIGATTAIFSVVQSVLLRPLPYERPDELVMVWGRLTERNVEHFPMSPPDLKDVRESTNSFVGLAAAFTFDQALASPDGDPVQVPVGGATSNLFRLLGVRPALGRDFVESDGDPTDPTVQPGDPAFVNNSAILSHALWQQRFGGDPSVIGRIIEVGGAPTEIVGVLPSGFQLLLPSVSNTVAAPALWSAMRIDYENAPRNNVFLQVVGRLGPGVGLARARAEADQLATRLRETYPVKASTGYEMSVEPLHAALVAPVRPVILSLMAAVGLVLLIACANVSNLLLVRGSRREREVAIRAAVGGSRWRILRQMLLESGVLAIGGAVLGTAFAWFGTRLLLALRPAHLPRLDQVGLDANILAFAVAAAAVSSLVFGLVPALQGSRIHLSLALKERGPSSDARSQRSLRNGVVVAEVALSTVLLIGAGLMVRSFDELRNVEPGYQPSGVLTLSVPVPFARYPNSPERAQLLDALRERLAAMPGVESASAVFPLPLDGVAFNGRWGTPEAQADPTLFRQADFAAIEPDYFEAMGTRLEEGRDMTRAEHADSAGVVVIDRTLADLAYPGESAVGRQLMARIANPDESEFFEIVGVVESQRLTSLAEQGRGTIFFPDRYVGSFASSWVLRTNGDVAQLVGGARAAVADIDPTLPIGDVQSMDVLVDGAMADTRFALVLLIAFGVLAMVLASVGLYGVLAYVVRQRRAEIGVRLAFGAGSAGIIGLVLRQGLGLAAAGIAVGLLAGYAFSGLLDSLLVGVPPTDLPTFAAVGLLFLAVATLSCVIPALRASRVDPVQALREQ